MSRQTTAARVALPPTFAVAALLLVPATALADNCSSLGDCWSTASGAASAALGTAFGALGGLFGGFGGNPGQSPGGGGGAGGTSGGSDGGRSTGGGTGSTWPEHSWFDDIQYVYSGPPPFGSPYGGPYLPGITRIPPDDGWVTPFRNNPKTGDFDMYEPIPVEPITGLPIWPEWEPGVHRSTPGTFNSGRG